jgi:hypothetical protein
MAPQNDTYETRPDKRPPPSYAVPPLTEERRDLREREETAAKTRTGNASAELLLGGGAIVLSILGLLGLYPATFAKICAIAVGAGLVSHGMSATASKRRSAAGERHGVRADLGGEAIGGAAGAVLGILALFGILPAILMPVSAIVLGGSMLLGAPSQAEKVGGSVVQTARASAGIESIAGVGAIVLGIIALLRIGPNVPLTLVAMLALGGAMLLTGGSHAMSLSRSSFRQRRSYT